MGIGKKRCGRFNPMGMGKKRRRCTGGLDWIFNPMGMGKKRCAALFNPMGMGMGMGMGKRRRCGGGTGIFNPMGMGIKKRCGDEVDLVPEDVLISILVCLPVKSLLRFKSVSKSWRQLIQTPFFIDLHTTFNSSSSSSSVSSSSSRFGAFIIQTREPSDDDYEGNIKLYKLSSGDDDDDDDDGDDDGEDDDNVKEDVDKKMVFKVDDLLFLPIYKDYLLHDTLRMVGSCNGIICLHDPKVMEDSRAARQDCSNLRDVCLWNPATRQFRILPKSIPIQEKPYYCLDDFIGFGFDVKTKDYKVLRITPWKRKLKQRSEEEEEGGCKCRVQVYSLSTDSWRLLEGINSLPVHPTSQTVHPDSDVFLNNGIYLNGSYFFVGVGVGVGGGRKSNTDEIMMSFDFTKEIFTTMQLPENENHISRHGMVLSSLGEKLALFDGCSSYYYDIWVLNEQQHGSSLGVLNKESWTKLHSKLLFKPGCISNNGEFALISTWENDDKFQLFNLVTKEAEISFLTEGCWLMHRAEVYKESLVSIMGGKVLPRWQLPTHGTTYKLNLDAPFSDRFRTFGIGLCLISDTGGCIGVRSLGRYGYVRNAKQGEALAMLEAIKWAKKLELSPIIIESYSKNVVSFFMDDDNNSTYWSSKALSLLRKAKLLLNSSELGISFQYCSRSCNYIAEVAAKLGSEGCWPCKEWTANSPGEMVRSLSKDLGNETWQGGELGC